MIKAKAIIRRANPMFMDSYSASEISIRKAAKDIAPKKLETAYMSKLL